MYALHSLYSPPGRLQRSGLIVNYGLTSIHTIHTFLPCASSHPSLIRASPHPPIYLGCACSFQQRAFCPPDNCCVGIKLTWIYRYTKGGGCKDSHICLKNYL